MSAVGDRRARLIGAGLVLLAASLAAFPGLEARDLTGDELGALGRDLSAMLDRSIEVHRPDQFSAHLPLAWILRSALHALFGPEHIFAWRLHTALAAVAGAGATYAFMARRAATWQAAAAGLLVGLSPILSFHARDSTNYAFDPLTGALTLAGLADLAEGRKRGGWVLFAGLLLGCANDYYFGFYAISALALTPVAILHASDRRAALKGAAGAWLGLGLLLAGPALLFVRRLRSTAFEAVIARHADEDTDTWYRWDELLDPEFRNLALSFQEGFEGLWLRDTEATGAAATLLLCAIALGALGRRPTERLAAGLVAGTVLLTIGFEAWFGARYGRAFPVFPRNWLTALPAMAVLQVALFARLGRWGAPLAGALVLLHGTATLRQVGNVSDTREVLVQRMLGLWQEGDAGITEPALDLRLPSELGRSFSKSSCVPAEWGRPRRVWAVRHVVSSEVQPLRSCAGEEMAGYRLRLAEDAIVPPHHYKTNSHLVSARLLLWDRGEPSSTRANWTVDLPARLLSGARWSTVYLTWQVPERGDVAMKPLRWAPRLVLPEAPEGARRLRILVAGWPLPEPLATWTPVDRILLDRPELPPLPEDPLDPVITQPVPAGSAPGLRALRVVLTRGVRWGGLLCALVGLLQTGRALLLRVRPRPDREAPGSAEEPPADQAVG